MLADMRVNGDGEIEWEEKRLVILGKPGQYVTVDSLRDCEVS